MTAGDIADRVDVGALAEQEGPDDQDEAELEHHLLAVPRALRIRKEDVER